MKLFKNLFHVTKFKITIIVLLLFFIGCNKKGEKDSKISIPLENIIESDIWIQKFREKYPDSKHFDLKATMLPSDDASSKLTLAFICKAPSEHYVKEIEVWMKALAKSNYCIDFIHVEFYIPYHIKNTNILIKKRIYNDRVELR